MARLRAGISALGVCALGLALLAHTASAQGRYRVLVGLAGGSKVAVVDFRPCVPAETSDCGVTLDRVVDASADATIGESPKAVRSATLVGGEASVAIENGRVAITRQSGKLSHTKVVRGLHGEAIALTPGPDAETVFVVSNGAKPGDPGEVCMIDLRFDEVVARIRLDGAPVGVAMARR